MSGRQRGIVLLASLVLVLILGVLGLSAMHSAAVQARIVGNQAAALQAFENAEAALLAGEASTAGALLAGPGFRVDYLGVSDLALGLPDGVSAALYRVTAGHAQVVLESFFARPLDAPGLAARRIAWRQIR
ncbi:hypothetical protein DCO48_04305 [Pseudomonas sp. SDI]|uniref:PilX N-terminal domain-containing pilus assembly protein n=1 Tax=Pseudomonas sp. SDI TaxID=2170734 RepID=UPI000DE79605|nr:PilX N-terminal domain-containing pilus assembly protein [Pseudomonas sp. SDI]PWB34824.1 hypothetical protein DCO48_04305 [Pseudomonas sp. SDI]